MKFNNLKIGIIGLGYVGLPLAVEFGKKNNVIGFDNKKKRISNLKLGFDSTLVSNSKELKSAKYLNFTNNINDLKNCNCYIIAVPTPLNKYKRPNLDPLRKASKFVGKILKINDIVIYESTVYPGTTEEECVPILEQNSGLKFNCDFYCGYSPERINPGDKKHRLVNIKKITSGSSKEAADFVDALYKKIIRAGTHKVKSIRVAEAAKVIENTQRDLNIALVNELAVIFNRLGIDTQEVLEAAGSKWNFMAFQPGLVGGHCIGVDPYYLTYKAEIAGYKPQIILAGRKLNDCMGFYVTSQLFKSMREKRIKIKNSHILLMGLTFKENVPDLRNTQVIDIYKVLKKNRCLVDVFDPWADYKESKNQYKIKLINEPKKNAYDAIIITVAHDIFKQMKVKNIREFGKDFHILYDLKYIFSEKDSDLRL